MDPSEKELIRERADLVDVISGYTALKPSGNKYKGLCPFHQEKTPSFIVDPERGRWHCFGQCQEGGDVFTFLQKADNLSFLEAAEQLAERFGISLSGRGDSEEAKRQKSERDRIYAANAAAVSFFRELFARATLPRQYAQKRGLVHETLEDFAVGFAPEDWDQLARYLQRNKIHPEDAVKAGLITASRRGDGTYIDRFRGRLIFPIWDVQERVVGFGGRLIVENPEAPKYLNSPETPVFSKSRILYALNRARKAISQKRLAVVVEGYMDAVAAHQAGIPYVVATLGTALTEEHVRLLQRYVGDKGTVVLSFDSDKAGVNAALKAAELIAAISTDLTLRVLALPPGEDPDSLIASGNVAAFHRAIDEAFTVPEFRLRTLENTHDLSNETSRMSFLREAIGIVAALPSLLEQDRLIRQVASFHPSFAQNSLRAEELIRAEVEQTVRRNAAQSPAVLPTFEEDPYGVAPPPRRAIIGTRDGMRDGSGGNTGGNAGKPFVQRNGGYANGNARFGNSRSGKGRYGGASSRRGYDPRTERGFPPQALPRAAWNATTMAERTVLRAMVSPDWLPVLQRVLDGHHPVAFSPEMVRLFEVLWAGLAAGTSPADTLDRLADPELLSVADQALMQEIGPDLSEQAIADAIIEIARSIEEARSAVTPSVPDNTDGTASEADLEEERLKEWFRHKRNARGGPEALKNED
ncbi:MAG: hypothetical protein OHK0029_30690 [Armatimonadaceae bacterium]